MGLGSTPIYGALDTNGVTYISNDPTAHILSVDLTNPAIKFRTVLAKDKGGTSRESVESMAKRYNAFAAVNADYFGAGYGPEGMTYIDGNKINYDDKRTSLAISSQNQPSMGKGDRPGFMYNVVGGGPQFIAEGKAYWNRTGAGYVNGEYFPNSSYWDGGTFHTAAGVSKDRKKLILIVTKTTMKPLDVASKLIQLGGWTGMKFDGGGSSSMYFNNKVLRKGRDIADALVIIPKDLRSDAPPMPYEDYGICSGEACRFGEWVACQNMEIRKERDKDSPVAFQIAKGEKVAALTGVVITTKPGRATLLKSLKIGNFHADQGDNIYLLTYRGEGIFNVWFKGRMYNNLGDKWFDNLFSPGYLKVLDYPETTDWVKIQNSKGQIGWRRLSPQSYFDYKYGCE